MQLGKVKDPAEIDFSLPEDNPDTKRTGLTGQICGKTITAEYREINGNKGVFVHLTQFTEASGLYKAMIEKLSYSDKLGNYDVLRLEHHEIGWFSSQFDCIITQEGVYKVNPDGSEQYSYPNKATGDNSVTKYFIEKYPPTKWALKNKDLRIVV